MKTDEPCCEHDGSADHALYGCGGRGGRGMGNAAVYSVIGFMGLLLLLVCVGTVIRWWPT